MKQKSTYFKVFALILLSSLVSSAFISKKKLELKKKLFLSRIWKVKSNYQRNCSLDRCGIVNNILNEDFYPIFVKYGLKIPAKCPFNKDRNLYKSIESNKLELASANWKCDFCGKKFYSEDYLNRHMMKKHSQNINGDSSSVCVADYCDIFRCDLHEQYPNIKIDYRTCDSKNTRKLQRKCEKTLNLCLPDAMQAYVYDTLSKALCASLTCEKFFEPFEDISLWKVLILSLFIPVFAIIVINGLCYYCENVMGSDNENYYHSSEYKYKMERMNTAVLKGNRKYYQDTPWKRKR